MEIKIRDFGLGSDLISLTNKAGVTISFTNLGARIVDWQKDGKHLILGFDSAKEYLEKDAYPGATVGPTAGRIKDGLVKISGKDYILNQNEGPQTLHGGDEYHNLFEMMNYVCIKPYMVGKKAFILNFGHMKLPI